MNDVERMYLALLRQRLTEDVEARHALEELGDGRSARPLTAEDVDEQYGWVFDDVAAEIRREGHAALADRYQLAHTRARRGLTAQMWWLALRAERSLSAVEHAEANAADMAGDEARDWVARVQAEAIAYLKRLDENGNV